jgi:hypothetical protein
MRDWNKLHHSPWARTIHNHHAHSGNRNRNRNRRKKTPSNSLLQEKDEILGGMATPIYHESNNNHHRG